MYPSHCMYNCMNCASTFLGSGFELDLMPPNQRMPRDQLEIFQDSLASLLNQMRKENPYQDTIVPVL